MMTQSSTFTKSINGDDQKKPSEYKENLFPIKIPKELHGELIAPLAIRPILKNKFEQHLITRLGQLDGMTPDQFLVWRGFGSTCLKELASMVASLNAGGISKLASARYENLSKSQLTAGVLQFAFDRLNVSTLLKAHLRNEFAIETVSHFIDAFEIGKLSRPNIGTKTLEQVWAEVSLLAEHGAEKYLNDISLDSRTFLEVMRLIREGLSSRDQAIFDHRFCPLAVEFLTLQALASKLDLTRERIRQIEKALVKRLQSGTLRELGWLVRRKTLALFKPPVRELGFRDLLDDVFFTGVPSTFSALPAPFVFLDRVFYSTFIVTNDAIAIKTI